jgi:hypothetical protein
MNQNKKFTKDELQKLSIMSKITKNIIEELESSNQKHGAFNSTHEALAVIREEYLEFEQEIFHGKDKSAARQEAIQLAAMAVKFIAMLDTEPKIIMK